MPLLHFKNYTNFAFEPAKNMDLILCPMLKNRYCHEIHTNQYPIDDRWHHLWSAKDIDWNDIAYDSRNCNYAENNCTYSYPQRNSSVSTSCRNLSYMKNGHTTYSWNIMCQKWEGDCGLWVLNEIILKKYAESLKKIVGAVWELPAK